MSYIFRNAKKTEASAVLALYESVKGKGFCVWDESYPTMHEIEKDLATDGLFVAVDGDKVIATLSVVPENELDAFDCFAVKEGAREIARIAVSEECRGKGLAFFMVSEIEKVLRTRDVVAIHISAEKHNLPALKTYSRAGFQIAGEAELYGGEYFLLEKVM